MMIDLIMKNRRKNMRPGVALLVVLIVVMTITVLSLGYLSRSDVELACGANMVLHSQMDYLAESGLEHAKGLLVRPYEIDGEYWAGATRQQLVAGSDEYYDVAVTKLGELNYKVNSIAYKEKDGEQVGRSGLEAVVRLDPCVGYFVNSSTNILSCITINGDVFCNGHLNNSGVIIGDVFASDSIAGVNIAGQKYTSVSEMPVCWPGLVAGDFSDSYFLYEEQYAVQQIVPGDHNNVFWGHSAGNPKGVYFCSGDLRLSGNVNVDGTLVVNGNLQISGFGNSITSVKNFPALLVNGKVILESGARFGATGLVQVNNDIIVESDATDVLLDVFGALCSYGGIKGMVSSGVSINITAAPSTASVQTWPSPGVPVRWSPAAGAFYKSIVRR